MATQKKARKAACAASAKKVAVQPVKGTAPGARKESALQQVKTCAAEPRQPAVKRAEGPTARTCPLVLDGEMDASDFSPRACLTCDEFDCRFCQAAEGSGALRSRLFASDEEGEESEAEENGWGEEPDSKAAGEEEPGDAEDEDLF